MLALTRAAHAGLRFRSISAFYGGCNECAMATPAWMTGKSSCGRDRREGSYSNGEHLGTVRRGRRDGTTYTAGDNVIPDVTIPGYFRGIPLQIPS